MKKFLIGLGIFLVIVLIIAFSIFSWVRGTYNNLVALDEQVNGAWAQLENVLQRRMDLIPNLVATVKGYASHEEEVLTKVTEARAKVGGAGTPNERLQAEGELSSALSRLMVVVENYPDLKANQNFLSLQDQLEGTENRIAVERGRFIESVRMYNQTVRTFPTTVIAGMLGFSQRETFSAQEGAQTAPKVNFE